MHAMHSQRLQTYCVSSAPAWQVAMYAWRLAGYIPLCPGRLAFPEKFWEFSRILFSETFSAVASGLNAT